MSEIADFLTHEMYFFGIYRKKNTFPFYLFFVQEKTDRLNTLKFSEYDYIYPLPFLKRVYKWLAHYV